MHKAILESMLKYLILFMYKKNAYDYMSIHVWWFIVIYTYILAENIWKKLLDFFLDLIDIR